MNDDLISREALKNALNYIYDCAYIDSKSKEGIASDIIAEIDNAPAVEPIRSKGAWLHNSDRPDTLICSVCNCGWDMWRYERKELKYCPNCGSDMSEAEE